MSNKIKVIHLSTSDYAGGAARAAYRIHRALLEYGIDSRMRVLHSDTDDTRVTAGAVPRSIFTRLALKIYNNWLAYYRRNWHSDNPIMHSFGYNGIGLVNELNASNADILNLHWISDLLSVKNIGKLKKPIVWRLADMWAFCGAEHYSPDNPDARFIKGYHTNNRPLDERGPDLNRQTWLNKRRMWAQQHFNIICTTHWLANCARRSVLFADAPINVIPNTLDTTNIWKPISKNAARLVLNLPPNKKMILMGAVGGLANPYKGGDLLREIMAIIATRLKNVELMIYGQNYPVDEDIWPCPVHWLGKVNDDRVLAQVYSSADVMIVPSRLEAFGQAASEAQACGTPVVAFDNSGLADIVIHRETGWLARAFDTNDAAQGILWVTSDEERWKILSRLSREKAVVRFSPSVVAKQYATLYEKVLSKDHRGSFKHTK